MFSKWDRHKRVNSGGVNLQVRVPQRVAETRYGNGGAQLSQGLNGIQTDMLVFIPKEGHCALNSIA